MAITKPAAWYTFYFLTERGRAGLTRYTDELCGLLWRQWSLTWTGGDAAFPATAPSPFEVRLLEGTGHNVPHEVPEAFARAVSDLAAAT